MRKFLKLNLFVQAAFLSTYAGATIDLAGAIGSDGTSIALFKLNVASSIVNSQVTSTTVTSPTINVGTKNVTRNGITYAVPNITVNGIDVSNNIVVNNNLNVSNISTWTGSQADLEKKLNAPASPSNSLLNSNNPTSLASNGLSLVNNKLKSAVSLNTTPSSSMTRAQQLQAPYLGSTNKINLK